jgi:acetyl esterase/lipase
MQANTSQKLVLIFAAWILFTPLAMAQSAAPRPRAEEMAYGNDPLQKLDFWRGRESRAPLIVFVHGGGWRDGDKAWIGKATAAHYVSHGFAYASINYRLVPDATVEQQAQDVADAVASLLARADKLGIEQRRIMLMGHSSGGHLAALIGTDPRYLRQAGLEPAMLGAVVLLEGAGLAPRQPRSGEPGADHPVFGSPERQLALSPTSHTATPNAGSFLMLIAGNAELRRQATVLSDALRAAATSASIVDIPNSNHNELVTDLGSPGDRATAVIADFAKRVFAFNGGHTD